MRALRDREARLRARRLIRFLARWLSLTVCDLDLREVRERVLIVAAIPLSVSSNDRRKKMTRRTSAEPLYDIAPCAISGIYMCLRCTRPASGQCHPLKSSNSAIVRDLGRLGNRKVISRRNPYKARNSMITGSLGGVNGVTA